MRAEPSVSGLPDFRVSHVSRVSRSAENGAVAGYQPGHTVCGAGTHGTLGTQGRFVSRRVCPGLRAALCLALRLPGTHGTRGTQVVGEVAR